MTHKTILYRVEDRVATIVLNRPDRMNALSLELCSEVTTAVQEADRDPEVRVLIITGAGDKAFSAGYDLKDNADKPVEGVAAWSERLNAEQPFNFAVWNCSKPVIAMISGYCLAGALEFAQMCDMRYASEDSRFGVVETRFSAGVAAMIMPWIVGHLSRELIYSGDIIDAREAHRIGLVNRVFPKAELEREVTKIAKRMSRNALACLQWNKRAINHTFEVMGLMPAMKYGVEACTILDSTRTPEAETFGQIARAQGLQAALKWRKDQFAPFE